MLEKLKGYGAQAIDLILPLRCVSCGEVVEGRGGLCGSCWAGIRFIAPPLCETTGVPLDSESGVTDLTLLNPDLKPLYRKARAVWAYDEASRKVILRFKNGDQTHMAPLLAEMMVRAAGPLLQEADLICPVPLHWRRFMFRKFNQSALLAQSLSAVSGLPALPDLLQRRRHTPSQGGLKKEERQANIRQAFRLNPAYTERVSGQRILLVDDVYTTGATLTECTKVLLEAGAGQVDVVTLARVL